MRLTCLVLGALLSFGTVDSRAIERNPQKLTIFNDSGDDIIVVVETPSLDLETASKRVVEVPSRAAVFNIPFTSTADDQFAIAYKAHATPDGLKLDVPVTLVGFSKIIVRLGDESPGANTTMPILRFRGGFDPRSKLSDETTTLFSSRYSVEARALFDQATQATKKIDYEQIATKRSGVD
jgi:hypothetical protein